MAAPSFRFSTRTLSVGIQSAMVSNHDAALKTMTVVSHFLRAETDKRTPKLEGPLTAELTPTVVPYKNSFAALVYIPVNGASSKYAIKMHEGVYNIGWRSREKQSKTGQVVGRRFMVRALDDNREKIITIIVQGMKL